MVSFCFSNCVLLLGFLGQLTSTVLSDSSNDQDDHVEGQDEEGMGTGTELRSYRLAYSSPVVGDQGSGRGGSGHDSNRATITFPGQATNETLERRKPKGGIPLKLLRKFNTEKDLSKIFDLYVTNVKLQDSDGQKYYVDLDGRPIDVGLEALTQGPPKAQLTDPTALVEKPLTAVNRPNSFSSANRYKQTPLSLQDRVGIPTRVTKPAICEPELRTVEIPAPNDPNVVQFPKCVRLERCGGCCGSDLLICEPVRTTQTEVQVQRFAYNDDTEKLEYRETQVILLPSHTQCRCNCRVKATDCSDRHSYNSDDCLCACKNSGEQELCAQRSNKLWDVSLCQCVCREIKACSSGYTFNVNSCDCVVNTDRRRQGLTTDDEHNTARNRREFGRLRFLRQ